MRDYKKSSLSNVKWIHADMLKFRSTFIELEIQRESRTSVILLLDSDGDSEEESHSDSGCSSFSGDKDMSQYEHV